MDNHDKMMLEEELQDVKAERDRFKKYHHDLAIRHGFVEKNYKTLQENVLVLMEKHVNPPIVVTGTTTEGFITVDQYQKQKLFYKKMKEMSFWQRLRWSFNATK